MWGWPTCVGRGHDPADAPARLQCNRVLPCFKFPCHCEAEGRGNLRQISRTKEEIAPQAFPSVTTPVCGLARNDIQISKSYSPRPLRGHPPHKCGGQGVAFLNDRLRAGWKPAPTGGGGFFTIQNAKKRLQKIRYFYIEKYVFSIYIYDCLCYHIFGEDWDLNRFYPKKFCLMCKKPNFSPLIIVCF